jgi:hypothetical protein
MSILAKGGVNKYLAKLLVNLKDFIGNLCASNHRFVSNFLQDRLRKEHQFLVLFLSVAIIIRLDIVASSLAFCFLIYGLDSTFQAQNLSTIHLLSR